nr:MAG TPA: hypothetical protein [Caudoviricetes sp.]
MNAHDSIHTGKAIANGVVFLLLWVAVAYPHC